MIIHDHTFEALANAEPDPALKILIGMRVSFFMFIDTGDESGLDSLVGIDGRIMKAALVDNGTERMRLTLAFDSHVESFYVASDEEEYVLHGPDVTGRYQVVSLPAHEEQVRQFLNDLSD